MKTFRYTVSAQCDTGPLGDIIFTLKCVMESCWVIVVVYIQNLDSLDAVNGSAEIEPVWKQLIMFF